MVRAFKKLQTLLVSNGILEEELPSYLIECIVYNVPNPEFNKLTYVADMRNVLAFLFKRTLTPGSCSEWHEVHELRYLSGGSGWDYTRVHALAEGAWDYIGFQ